MRSLDELASRILVNVDCGSEIADRLFQVRNRKSRSEMVLVLLCC